MALAARHALPGHTRVQVPTIPRPDRRAVSLSLGLGFLILLIDGMINARAFFDLWLLKAIQRFDAPGLHGFFEIIERLTSSEGAIASWALAVIFFLAIRWWAPAVVLGLLPIGGVINTAVGMFLVDRSRPHLAELTRTSSNWEERSFPSGHVQGAVMLYGLIFVIARKIENRSLRLGVQGLSLGVIATMGIERVWEGAHWPSDVFGAYALGGLLLIGLVAVYDRLDAAIAGLPLIRAQAIAHDESLRHAHALTSLVVFDGDRVSKVYAPGLLPRALYWIAFQAPFPYIANEAALRAAMHRRELASQLTEYWFGSRRVARITGIDRLDSRLAVTSELVDGHAPTNRKAAKAFLTRLRFEFEQAGLPTWQIDPSQPRAIDNVLEKSDSTYHIVDLESGLVSPMASRKTWFRALRRGLVPFYDDVFFDVTRGYVAREEATMRAAMGDQWVADLTATIDAGEVEARAWHESEPRIWTRMLRAVMTGFGVRTWRARLKNRFATSNEKAQAWMDKAITTWETEGRLTAEEGVLLREQVAEPTFQAMLPYLGAHILISIPLRFPFGSIGRFVMVAGALAAATGRYLSRRITREEWKIQLSIHSPLVMVLSAVPGVGSFAYLAAKPVRANRLLLRTLTDAALGKAPWQLYERIGLRRFVARPSALERKLAEKADARGYGLAAAIETSSADGPAWELAWAAQPSVTHAVPHSRITPALLPTATSSSLPHPSPKAA